MDQTKTLPTEETTRSESSPSRFAAMPRASLALIAAVLETIEETGFMDLANALPEEVLGALSDVLGESFGQKFRVYSESLWTRKDVAAYGQCSLRHVDALIADRTLVPIKIGRLSRFDPAAVKAAFAKSTRARRGLK